MPLTQPYRVELHDTSGVLVEILDLAHRVGYEKAANKASLAHFDLPHDDPKRASVTAFREIWLYRVLSDTAEELVDVLRVMPITEARTATGIKADFICEGWATVLQDDLVAAELIFTNQTVTAILTALLAYQIVARVSLGTIDAALNATISMRVSYENVMRAAWEVRNIVGGYISVDPLAGTPTTRQLHLRANPGQDIGQRINLGLNLREITKRTDPTLAITKLYPLGRGEGPNQQRPSTDKLTAAAATLALVGGGRSTLTIDASYSRYKGWTAAGAALPDGSSASDTRSRPLKVWKGAVDDSANWQQGASERQLRSAVNDYNPGGGPHVWTLDYVHADHLIADDTVATYGTIARPLAEKRSENSDALIRTARIFLDSAKQARVTHELRVADLARVYPTETFERIALYDQVNVYDPDLGITLKDRVVVVRYGDMADPSTFEIAVTNAEPLSNAVQIADRVRKYESMPDGATNIWVDSFEDNVDATHPYTRRIYIPPDAISVNKVQLSFETKPYRYYVSGSATTVIDHNHSTSSTAASTYSGPPDHEHQYGAPTGTTGSGGSTHSHAPTAGIVESTTATAITLTVDGNAVSGTPITRTDFDLTPYLTKDADGKIVRGWHSVQFSPNAVGRIQGAIIEVVFLQSRGVVAG